MRAGILLWFGMSLPLALAGQAAPAAGNDSALAPLPPPSLGEKPADGAPAGNATDIPLDVPSIVKVPEPFSDLGKIASLESRPPAQLEAILRGYVGHWRGETNMRVVGINKLISFPLEMDCVLETRDGKRVLVSTTRYTFGGEPVVETERTWVQDGRIVSEVIAKGAPRLFFVHTNGDSLVWSLAEPNRSPVDYNHVETIKLTAAGGELVMTGFEVTDSPHGPAMLCESTDLKLVK